jgi:hypothetical protein
MCLTQQIFVNIILTMRKREIIVALVSVIALMIAVLAWLFPVNLFGPSLLVGTPTCEVQQTILLRWAGGSDYIIRANEPTTIYYEGEGVPELDLATQGSTSFVVELAIDGFSVAAVQPSPTANRPLHCPKDFRNSYWIYYMTTVAGFSPGVHNMRLTASTLRALPDDPGGNHDEPGELGEVTFKLTAK